MENEHLFRPNAYRNEGQTERGLRPAQFSEFVGQKKVLDNINVMIESANIRGQAMDHCLLSGPPGLGKTSLAMIIARELGSELQVISGPALDKKGDLAAILGQLAPRDVLFIDEIHRLHIAVEEVLYSAMEDFRLDIVLGQGVAARTMRIELAPFTLIGATTRSGLLSNPLRTRFMANLHFDFYQTQDLVRIVELNAQKLGVKLAPNAALHIAQCGRGTPRIANRILRRVRDFALVDGTNQLGKEQVEKSLSTMDIDRYGLDRMDRKILNVIKDYYSGGPVGIEALCATLAEDRVTIEDVFEPYLLKEGLLVRTPRGREITDKARNYLI